MGELIEEVLTSAWFYNPIEISGLELPLHFALRLNAFGCDLAPTDGFESKSRFILTEETYWSGQSSDRYGLPSQQRHILSEFFRCLDSLIYSGNTHRSCRFGCGFESVMHQLMHGFVGGSDAELRL